MGKISWELTAIAVARYAHEIRVPVSRAIDKLLDDAGLDPATTTETNKYKNWIVSHATDGTEEVPSDTRYLSVMKRMITQCLINLKKVNKTGDETLDTSIVEFYNSDTGRELLHGLYSALKKLDNPSITNLFGTVTDADMPCIVVCNDAPSEYNTFNVPQESDANMSSGVVVRGTASGIGEITMGKNLLPQCEYAVGDGLSNESRDPSLVGDITISFYPDQYYNVPPIPPGTPYTGAYQQWIGMEAGGYVHDHEWALDERIYNDVPSFQNAQWKTTLPAGSYKLHCECILISGSGWAFYSMYDRIDDWYKYASISLLASDGTEIIHKNVATRTSVPSDDVLFSDLISSYDETFFHEEIPFTLSESTEIGLITQLYWYYNRRGDIFFRFYITDSTVVATPFDNGTYSGVTAWEPYGNGGCKLTLTAKNLLDGSSDSEEKDIGSQLDDEHTTTFFENNSTVMASLNAGLVELDILEKDSQGNSGKISTKYLR